MIYTPAEYAKKFPIKGKVMSAMTIKRRCEKGMLPSNHLARKLPGETGSWVIEITDEIIPEVTPVVKTKSMNQNHYSW
jgi:hypothetical protein